LGLDLNHGYFRQEWGNQMCSLAGALYTISKNGHFCQSATLLKVRKQLKASVRAFGDHDSPTTSGLLGLGLTNMRSLSHSPQGNIKVSNNFLVADESSTDIPFQFSANGSRISSSIPSSSGSSTSVSTHPFTPFGETDKWHINENYPQGAIETSNLSPSTAVQQQLHNGTPMQAVWYSQAPPMLNFQAAGPANQWVWSNGSAEDTTYIPLQALDMEET
jgi:hypothetical protein